mmetsp:Transcript_5075/g.3513  ORF Transcript_5075/g.3513 Transcript_5075/m.3513 type:complete len:129 (+) Transcript_5075:308-694(+)
MFWQSMTSMMILLMIEDMWTKSKNHGLKLFLRSPWNLLDLLLVILNIAILVGYALEIDVIRVRIVACVAATLMWLKVFYWFRIFREPAKFIRMIKQILYGSMTFTMMLTVCIIMFTNAFMILNNNRDR